MRSLNIRSKLNFIILIILIHQLYFIRHHGGFNLFSMICGALYFNLHRNKGNLLANYFNNLLSFRKIFEQNEPSKFQTGKPFSKMAVLSRWNILLFYFLLLTPSTLSTVFVLSLHWTSPCKPSLTGYFLLRGCCSNCKLSQW